ncbi:unnamed protein product [Cyprideis torosa]|uniref:Uncharacterized protein n=1 Tax=Cyprideis torosa TaxID=163714 RepID=A0A7R8ZR06_9CRUS|nr:unnamed protein product [Cyprideis torosa]CAG0902583.1 unnamed protein product [Cyprideis torosa]
MFSAFKPNSSYHPGAHDPQDPDTITLVLVHKIPKYIITLVPNQRKYSYHPGAYDTQVYHPGAYDTQVCGRSNSGAGGGGSANSNNAMDAGGAQGQKDDKHQIVHMRGDSDSELQALFDAVLSGAKPNQGAGRKNELKQRKVAKVVLFVVLIVRALLNSSPLSRPSRSQPLPWKQRNLPPSFFRPPNQGTKSPSVAHSRESSGDSTCFQPLRPPSAGGGPQAVSGGGEGGGQLRVVWNRERIG